MIHEILNQFDACNEAKVWAKGKTWQEIYTTCHRGDWLLWLFARTNPDDLQILTLAKGHCANTVRHLMKDPRSIKAVDTAIAFGDGKATREQLDASAAAATYADAAADAAYAAAASAYTYAAAAAAYAAAASAYTYAAAAADAAYAAAAAAYAAAAYAARTEIQTQTADICRKYLPIEIWNITE